MSSSNRTTQVAVGSVEVALDTAEHSAWGPILGGGQEVARLPPRRVRRPGSTQTAVEGRDLGGVQDRHPLRSTDRPSVPGANVVPHLFRRDFAARQPGERSRLRGDMRDSVTDRPFQAGHPCANCRNHRRAEAAMRCATDARARASFLEVDDQIPHEPSDRTSATDSAHGERAVYSTCSDDSADAHPRRQRTAVLQPVVERDPHRRHRQRADAAAGADRRPTDRRYRGATRSAMAAS